jgi:beta-glucosidase-like glycosyl hydrolase/CubicO group peptidase (beta-lactamase class C family)
MSYQEKLGQLFMVDAFSNKDSVHVQQIATLIDSFKVGGLIFFKGTPYKQALLTNYYQSLPKVPLMIGIDGEWGLSMRLDSTIRYPRQMTLTAGKSLQGVYDMGADIAKQCKRIGIQINFAPSVDINNNPLNPIINSRSFGENRDEVGAMSLQYMKGMQDNGILACAKHFPGHGNTDSDSHLTLPVVSSSLAELDTMELVPFRKLINDGLASVMVAHLFVPAVDSTPNRASTLSPDIVNKLLIEKEKFTGLIFTDALNMKGVASYYAPGELELLAFKAGNDVLLYSENIPKALDRLHLAIQNCEITQEEVDFRVKKILMAKYWSGLNNYKPIVLENLYEDLNTSKDQWLDYKLYESAITLVKNKNTVLPLSPYYRDCIASLVLNDTVNNPFQLLLNQYSRVDSYAISKDASKIYIDSILDRLEEYDRVIVSIHNTSTNAAKNFNLSDKIIEVESKLAKRKRSILCVFGNAYTLGKLKELDSQDALILGYEDTYLPQLITAQKIFGVSSFTGKLPITPGGGLKYNDGLTSTSTNLLKYTMPEEIGISSTSFSTMDSIIKAAIQDSVFPGCQLLVAVDRKVIINKSFGYFTYDSTHAVANSDLYDIASVTKIASTALAAMLLSDKHKLDIEAKASKYLPELRASNKKDLTLKQIMAHEAGLQAWIPFYKSTLTNTGLDTSLYKVKSQTGYSIQITDSLYLLDAYKDSIWKQIVESEVNLSGKYVYSDLGLLILQRIIEKITGDPIDEYVQDNFYKPLGISRIAFNPTKQFSKEVIAPTELDTAFRRCLVQGCVHDPAAAMLGGVAGNAGVFCNASALATIMQMLLDGGTYGGRQFIKPATIAKYTSVAFPGTANRRGLIFDKPEPDKTKNGPTAKDASSLTFGHTGFTGTCAWADPSNNVIFIFLSNRVYPSAGNTKITSQNIRTNLMQVVYNALKK